MEQRSDEWFQARCGFVTASRIADMLARTKSGWGASRANYRAQLVAERLTGRPQDSGYINGAMQHGIDTEPEAIAAYEFHTDSDVDAVGFVVHPEIERAGASPDGLIGEAGLVEVKCPNTANHISTLLDQKIPEKYVLQMYWQMACTGRQYCDFVSYDPRMPENMRLFIRRVERDDKRIDEIETEVSAFIAEVDETVEKLNKLEAA